MFLKIYVFDEVVIVGIIPKESLWSVGILIIYAGLYAFTPTSLTVANFRWQDNDDDNNIATTATAAAAAAAAATTISSIIISI